MNAEDTAEALAAMEAELTTIDEERAIAQQELVRRERILDARAERLKSLIDEATLSTRPVYPTQAHIDGIAKVAEMVHAGEDFGHHLGTDVDERGYVRFSSQAQRINLFALAPRRRVPPFGDLWEFTAQEEAALRQLLKSHNLRATEMWTHDDGFGAVLVSTKV